MGRELASALRYPHGSARTLLHSFVLLTFVVTAVGVVLAPDHALLVVTVGVALMVLELAWSGLRVPWPRQAVEVGRPVVIAMLAVVVSFCASVGFLFLRLEPIQDQGAAITQNALPSIEHLSATRTALDRLRVATRKSLLRSEGPLERATVDAARRQVDSELSAYRSLPKFAGELDLVADVDRAMVGVDESIAGALVEPASAPLVARVLRYDDLADAVERADSAIVRLEAFNADHVHGEAGRMMAVERATRGLGGALAVASILIAVISAALVIRNVGRQARLMAAHNELLAARATELEAFAGRVAHDLKNPLSTLTMGIWATQHRKDAQPRDLVDDLDRIARQTERMRRTIDGLLEFARAGANPERTARADVREVLDEVIEDVRPSADAARAVLRVTTLPQVRVACTPEALRSVLSNLVGNAVKYIVESRQPERAITIRVEEREHDARVEIEDTGPGLPEGFEERIFQPFVRLTNTSQPGTGLGLATVKKIVEAYGGRLGARSSEGRGSTFWFTMPKAT